jgi:hypothetical protein
VPIKDGDELANEVAATLRLLNWPDIVALWISGDDAAEFQGASALADFGVPVTEPPLRPAVRALIEQLPEEDHGAAVLALAVALGSGRPPLNLLPPELRPRTVSGEQLATVGMVLITVPVFQPIVTKFGYDPIWFAIIVVVMVEVGLIHPPVGMNLFVIQAQAPDVKITSIYRGIIPFLIAPLILIVLLFLFPGLALWLPKALYG